MIMSEQVSLQERTSQEPAQEPRIQTEKMELKWLKCNVHGSVQQKLCNASRDEKDVMCKMRISFQSCHVQDAHIVFKCFKLQSAICT